MAREVRQRRRRLVLIILSVLMVGSVGGAWWAKGVLAARVTNVVGEALIPPRPPYPPPFWQDQYGQTLTSFGWSGWVTALPPGTTVTRVSGTFTVPSGIQAEPVPSALAVWVGVNDVPLLQSGVWLNSFVGLTGTAIPSWAWVTDWETNSLSFTAPRLNIRAPQFTARPGDQIDVHMAFVPVALVPRLAGFWAVSHIVVKHGTHIVTRAQGRFYVPPWVEPYSVDAIVEAPSDAALPYGHSAVPVRWSVQLSRPWPSLAWARQHQIRFVSPGHAGGILDELTDTHITYTDAGERGSGIVAYANEGGT